MLRNVKVQVSILLFLLFTVHCPLSTIFAQSHAKSLSNNAFQAGETLIYDVRFSFIKGGEVTLKLSKELLDSNQVYYAVLQGRTIGIWEKMFHVDDKFNTWFDIETGLPYLDVSDVTEGKYKRFNEVRYDHSTYSLVSKRKGYKKMPSHTLDIVSVFYYIRRMDYSNIKPGEIRKYLTYFQDTIFPFEIKFKGREILNTKFGKVNCLKFVPVVEPGRIFKTNEDMRFWFTDDSNLIPIRIEFDMWVGSAIAEVREYKGLKVPLKTSK